MVKGYTFTLAAVRSKSYFLAYAYIYKLYIYIYLILYIYINEVIRYSKQLCLAYVDIIIIIFYITYSYIIFIGIG